MKSWMSNTNYNADTFIYRDACLSLSITVHASSSLTSPYVSMYHHRSWYMLMIVNHHTCIVFQHDFLLYPWTIIDRNICMVTNNHKHASQYTMVYAYIWKVDHDTCLWLSITVHVSSPLIASICSMYHHRPRCMLMIIDHHVCIIFPHFPFVSMDCHGPS